MAELIHLVTTFRIRRMLRDTNLGSPVFNTFRIEDEINAALRRAVLEVYSGAEWRASFVSYTASDDDYALSADAGYRAILVVRDNTTGLLLQRVSPEQIEQMREGQQGTSTPPSHYAIVENEGYETPTMELWPMPASSGTLGALVSIIDGKDAAASESTIISPSMDNVVSYYAASALADSVGDDIKKRLGLAPNASAAWLTQARALVEGEKRRASGIYTGNITLSDAVVD